MNWAAVSESSLSRNSMRDLLHHTTLARHLEIPAVLALLTTVLNFLPLQHLVVTIMVALPTISPLQALVLQVHSTPVVRVLGHPEVHLATLVPVHLPIRPLPLIHQPLPIWAWPVLCTTHHLECHRPAQLSHLPLQHTVRRLQALVKLALLQRLPSIHQLLPASLQPRQDTRRPRHNTLQHHQLSVQHRRRLQRLRHIARHLQVGVRRRQLMQVPLATNKHRLPHHNIRQPLQRLALRHQHSVRRLPLIRLRVPLSIHPQGVRALLRVHNTRQTVRRAPSTLPSKFETFENLPDLLLIRVLVHQRRIKLHARIFPVLYHTATRPR